MPKGTGLLALVGALAAGLLAAGRAAAVEPGDQCFDVLYGGNSKGTNALFERRHLQSGGPTWAAILDVAFKSLPALAGVAYTLDDEAEGVLVCTKQRKTLAIARAEYNRLNHDAKALAKMIDRVPPDRLE